MTKLALVCFSVCLLLSIYDVRSSPITETEYGVSDAAIAVIDKIKAGKEFRYGVFFVKNETIIDIESTGSRTASYDEYLKNLKVVTPAGKECRCGVIDFEFQCKSSPDKKKDVLVLMSWCPGEVTLRTNLIQAASVQGMKKAVPEIARLIQANSDELASMESVQDNLAGTMIDC